MAYSEAAVARAKEILKNRLLKSEEELAKRQRTAFQKCPELFEIKTKMAQSGLSVVRVMLEGGDGSERVSEIARENLELQRRRRELLVLNGFPEDYLKQKYFCERCSDTGYVDGRMCVCHKKLLGDISYELLKETSPVEDYSFDNFSLEVYSDITDPGTGLSARKKMEEVFDYCKNYAEDFGKSSESLFMCGRTGLGKTHLSLAIAGEVAKKGYNVIYGSAPNLLSKLENEKFGKDTESFGTESRLLDCDLLIIDDLGAEFSTPFTVAQIYNIVSSRIAYKKPVIISTNLSNKELQDKYTERIMSRIIGCYSGLLFFGKDVRQIKRFSQ